MFIQYKRMLIKVLTKINRYKNLTINDIYRVFLLWKPFNIMSASETIMFSV